LNDIAPIEPIAQNLKRLRLDRGLTLSALSRKAELGKATIFNIERGQGNPAIDTLWALARALEVPIGALFVDSGLESVDVLRYQQAPVLRDGHYHGMQRVGAGSGDAHQQDPDDEEDMEAGFVTRHLVSTRGSRTNELYWVDMAAEVTRESDPHTAGVIEHVVPIIGTLHIRVAGVVNCLTAGDRISFRADQWHSYETTGHEAKFLVIIDYP
jgi:XRE family transcriptional regulator, regulator of sulfur utilization